MDNSEIFIQNSSLELAKNSSVNNPAYVDLIGRQVFEISIVLKKSVLLDYQEHDRCPQHMSLKINLFKNCSRMQCSIHHGLAGLAPFLDSSTPPGFSWPLTGLVKNIVLTPQSDFTTNRALNDCEH